MPAERLLPDAETEAVVSLAHDFAAAELAPNAAPAEAEAEFPRNVYKQLGELGFLGMPYSESAGGGGFDYEVYLQVLEELAAAWA